MALYVTLTFFNCCQKLAVVKCILIVGAFVVCCVVGFYNVVFVIIDVVVSVFVAVVVSIVSALYVTVCYFCSKKLYKPNLTQL